MIYDIIYEHKDRYPDGHRKYHVRCKYCGWETDMAMSDVKRAKRCHHANIMGFPTRGWQNSRISSIYHKMLSRCYDPKDKSYRFYGDKGIDVCQQWIEDSASFEQWAIDNGYDDDLTIDRIDSQYGYDPQNCRWVTRENNSRYKSSTNYITVNGETKSGREWSKCLDVGVNRINRIMRNHGEEAVVSYIKKRLSEMKRCEELTSDEQLSEHSEETENNE